MKNLLAILILALGGTMIVDAQSIGNHKIRNTKKLVWFGIDCTQMQCIGRADFPNPDDIADRVVFAWNDLFISEQDKYDIHGAFQKNEFLYDLTSVEAQNEKLTGDQIMVTEATPLDKATIERVVSNYSSDKYDKGVGVLFIVEELNKKAVQGKTHVVLFDLETNEIIQSVKYTTEPGGFGIRNYWARTFYEIIEEIEDDYKKWLKKNKK